MGRRHVSRRLFLRRVGEGFAAAATTRLAMCDTRSSADQPNVLFICIDDLNDWVGCLGGHPDVKTPNLDRLASRGVLFTQAYCASPVCNSSRASLMTGIRPSTSGVYMNTQPWRSNSLLRDVATLPQHFMAGGYTALGAGKIYQDSFPDPPSWEEYWPSQLINRPDDPMPPVRPLNGIPYTGEFDWGPIDVEDEEMGDWQVTDWVIEQLRRDFRRPFFLACGIYRPHLPWYVPRKYFDLYPIDKVTLPEVCEEDLDDIPPAGRSFVGGQDHANVLRYDQWRFAVQAYLASISFADTCVGRLLDALDQSPYRDGTFIILWSDQGWHLGEKLHWRKFALWEEATHNVLMMAGPGIVPGGRCKAPVSLLDIYPTVTDLCGLSSPKYLEGRNLKDLLKNPGVQWQWPVVTTHRKGNHSVRSERWRYTRYADGSEELYDHTEDPMEWTNLASRSDLSDIKSDLARWVPEYDAPYDPVPERGLPPEIGKVGILE